MAKESKRKDAKVLQDIGRPVSQDDPNYPLVAEKEPAFHLNERMERVFNPR